MGIELPPLPENTVLLVEVGSTAHGTGLEGGEDHDESGVVVEAPDQVLGLSQHGFETVMHRTQPEGVRSGPGDTDRTLYSLRTFLRLATQGNPSILAALYTPVIDSTEIGAELLDLAPAFVGRHAVPRFRGYMRSQALRLLGLKGSGGHGKRGGGQREELVEAHGYDTKFAMHCARLGFQCHELLTTGRLDLPMGTGAGDWLRAVRRGEVPFDEWWERTLALDASLERLASDETVPAGPDRSRIEAFSTHAHRRAWGWA